MKKTISKQAFIAATLCILMSTAAHANEMINNEVAGIVNSDIVHDDWHGFNNEQSLNVGVISATSAQDNRVIGYVPGHLVQQTEGGGNTLKANVGYMRAATAVGNKVSGRIMQGFEQYAFDGGKATLNVGVLDAGERGTAIGNYIDGEVQGEVIQYVSAGSSSTINVGAIVQP